MFAASGTPAPRPRGGARRNPGDLGRRVARRRRELGLGIDELARRAAMTPGFVDWIETRPAELSPGELTRLAAALETSRVELLGGDRDVAPGRAGPDRRTRMVDLTEEECHGRLGRRGIGRVVFQMGGALIVRPVNYRVTDGVVLFRSETVGALAEAVGRRVVLEVDHLDDVMAEGWSVLVTGVAEEDRRDVDRPGADEKEPQPWAEGPRDLLVRIHPVRITGRELRLAAGRPTTSEP
ncbi:helix-turn-helix domain-containing protein [Streptacidiphilus rugosus]|uniref:helix-turn-helix domain-containing protein n=1 Tax=Streptacidiphilus rugosus TaxID=405783 RepID=UPI0007C6DA10|nr:pyridoxamine 5'-phosphate oxidase family protein [Streptacidiphilus rugosus]